MDMGYSEFMTIHTDHDQDLDEDALFAEDAENAKHKHVYLYEHASLTGARRCNRCGSFVAGDQEFLDLHSRMHDQLDVLGEIVAANEGTLGGQAKTSKTSKKKSKKS